MLGNKPKCVVCDQEIKRNEVVFVKMRWPEYRGMTEIKAYLSLEGKFICEECFNNKP